MAAAGFACTTIVPTLDREAELEACLASIAAAAPAYAAVVVVDQGARPALRARVEARGARYLHLERRGLSHARNVALRNVTTPWVHFLDDDATVSKDLLQTVAAGAGRHPDAAFLAARVVTPSGTAVMAGMDGRERRLEEPADTLATVMSPGLFTSRSLLERLGGFDERFGVGAGWPSGEESDLLLRAFAAGEHGAYLPDAVVFHPDPLAVRDAASRLRRARHYGRGLGALLAKHADQSDRARFTALARRFERRALGGAILSALRLRFDRAREYRESWRGRREGWRGWSSSGARP